MLFQTAEYIQMIKESNSNYNAKIENIRLKNLVEKLTKENTKIFKAKRLLEEYKEALSAKEKEIKKLRNTNIYLNEYIRKIPKFLRNFYIKRK